MITIIYLMVDLVKIEFCHQWKLSQCFFKWWTWSQMNFVVSGNDHNVFLSGGLGHKWILPSVEMITMIFWNGGLGHTHFFNLWNWSHYFFSIVAYSILTFLVVTFSTPTKVFMEIITKICLIPQWPKNNCDDFHPYKNLCE